MDVILCPTCSKEPPEGSRFCPFCGAKLREQTKRNTDPLIGTLFDGKYLVRKQIGSGAMGSIYLAEHKSLCKDVVLKVLHGHLVREESHIRRFHREARAASRLNHPNCITMLDFGQTDDGWFFICMEYVGGEDLCKSVFREGVIEPGRAVDICVQVLDALDEAHSRGVIHRDLKPENIMIEDLRTRTDFVKVLDFGIAKIRDTDGKGDDSSFKTATGMVFGTPEYMSPEQIRGEELDGRSDVYSLGVVLYQMLTGDLPFTGDSVLEVATQHLSEPPIPVSEKRPNLPAAYCKVVKKFMAKRPEERFADASEARDALKDAKAQAATEEAARKEAPSDEVFARTTNQMPRQEREQLESAADEETRVLAEPPIAIPEDPRPPRKRRSLGGALFLLLIILAAGAIAFFSVALFHSQ